MKIYYQGIAGAYGYITSVEVKKFLNTETNDIVGLMNFSQVWKKVAEGNIGVLPVENSYAGNIHENLYNFLRYDFKIIGEYNLKVNHCLLSKEKDIKDIKKVYSHPQGLGQCYDFLKKHNMEPIQFSDTASAAIFISESNESGVGAIASSLAGDIYDLNNLKEGIQDQDGNTTRFFIIAPRDSNIIYKNKSNKVTILFKTGDFPASLYKCLGAFATNNINLTKIESLPSLKDKFSYIFWLDFEGKLSDENVKKSLQELSFFTEYVKILGEY